MPFVYGLGFVIKYEIPKVWLVHRWVEILVITALAALVMKKVRLNQINTKLVATVVIFGFIAMTTSAFGVDPSKSFWGNPYRKDGLLTLFHLIGLFLFLSLFSEKIWFDLTAKVTGAGLAGLSIWALVDGFRLYVLKIDTVGFGAVGASFGQPNFLAGYLLIGLPILGYLISTTRGKTKLFWIVTLLGSATAILLTKSWGGVLGIGLICLTGLVRRRRIILGLVLSVGLVIMAAGAVTKQNDFVFEGRERIYHKAWLAFKERPILGWGWANFDYAFDSIVYPAKFDQDVYVDKTHGMLLEIMVTTGIVGLTAYLLIWLLLVRRLWKARNKNIAARWCLLLLAVFFLHSQVNVISINEELFFWVVLGLGGRED